MLKKIISLVLVVVMVAAIGLVATSCNGTKDNSEVKLGVILLHDETSTYDLNFLNGVNKAAEELGFKESQLVIKRNIPESNVCYETALDLVDEGCDIIFANSFGHGSFMVKAATENTDVQFCHATGTNAKTSDLKNFHNAFASIYEGRFLAGVAAGLKLNEMIDSGKITADQAKMGYVGAFTYAEVISGYTSFYLGAKSVCPSVTMDVQFTGSWYDQNAEKVAAISLINGGCVLISQHADSMGAPSACEEMGVPKVSYNGRTVEHCPNTFIVSSRIDWTPYFKYIVETVKNGDEIADDWVGTISTNSVVLTDINTKAGAEGTVEKLEEVKAKLADGSLDVLDTDTFTVTVTDKKNTNATVDENGKLVSYLADVEDFGDYVGETNVVENGAFKESKYRSAPYFDVRIDGIELLND